jgi:hypothetical protein
MQTEGKNILDTASKGIDRRTFLQYTGMGMAAAALASSASSCKKDNNGTNAVNLGSGDTGILNYAYALEQLEAAFYIKVIASPYSGMTPAEQGILTDIMNHEIVHRDFFKAALGSSAIISLTPNFSSINFSDRTSVLTAAKTFEDLGVSAYNGAGHLFSNTTAGNTYLLLAGKIVSVEARHAAALRDLLSPLSSNFAGPDVISGNGLDQENSPTVVLASANTYLSTPVNGSNLPS